jgi:hypothetical protein
MLYHLKIINQPNSGLTVEDRQGVVPGVGGNTPLIGVVHSQMKFCKITDLAKNLIRPINSFNQSSNQPVNSFNQSTIQLNQLY